MWSIFVRRCGRKLNYCLTKKGIMEDLLIPFGKWVFRGVKKETRKKYLVGFGRDEYDPMTQLFYWRVRPKYMIGNRDTTISSCRGHGLAAHHHFQRQCPYYMTGNRGTSLFSFRGRPPQKVTKLWWHTSEELLSHLGHCWATPVGDAPMGVMAPVLRNG